jgi:thiol-disulfide isomerase/thioredoxin
MRGLRLHNPRTPTVVWIYAEWCGHCQRFLPVWNELVTVTDGVKFVALDAEGEDFTRMKFPPEYPPVRGFPTIWIISPAGSVEDYRGPRNVKSLQEAINNSR